MAFEGGKCARDDITMPCRAHLCVSEADIAPDHNYVHLTLYPADAQKIEESRARSGGNMFDNQEDSHFIRFQFQKTDNCADICLRLMLGVDNTGEEEVWLRRP